MSYLLFALPLTAFGAVLLIAWVMTKLHDGEF